MSTASLYFVYPGSLQTLTGGYGYDRALIHALRQQGQRVETLALSARFPYPDKDALTAAQQAFAALPDDALVIVDGLAFGVLDALTQAEARRLRIVALCHHPLALESGLSDSQRQRFQVSEQAALQAARAVIVTSETTRRILMERFALPTERIRVALPGTAPRPFAPCQGDPPKLLTVASLTQRKAHDVLIDALAQLRALPWQADFIGGGDFDPHWHTQLREQVNRLQLEARIRFTGALHDLSDAYQGADLFVLPSRYEGYGMVFAEALAAGLPVVAARAGAVPDVVPESAGILVPPDDADALAAALGQVLTDPSRRQHLQAGARAAAARLPTWPDTARRVTQLIEELSTP